jgi:hypothetical protein
MREKSNTTAEDTEFTEVDRVFSRIAYLRKRRLSAPTNYEYER